MTAWLVTGGAGYIGSHVARRLAESGRTPIVLDDLSTGKREFVAPGTTFVEASIADTDVVTDVLREHDIAGVVHTAALKYAGVSVEEPTRFYRVNVDGMRSLLDAVVAAGVDRFVYSSSCSVYGTPTDVPVVESTRWAPESPYGETKLIGEWLVADVARAHGIRHTSLRYFNVVGSGYPEVWDASPYNLFPLMFQALEEGRPVRVFGTDYDTPDGSCIRDYVHVGDLADAHVAAAAKLEAGDDLRPAYNIGIGIGSSVLEVVAAMQRALGVEAEVELGPRRPGDPARIIGDPSLAAAELGWRATNDLDAMVRSAWAAWQQR